MTTRLELNSLLKQFVSNVYYQPPTNIQIKYPCILYERDVTYVAHADDLSFVKVNKYKVTYISKDPDDPVVDLIADLRLCALTNISTIDNLYHRYFTIYY